MDGLNPFGKRTCLFLMGIVLVLFGTVPRLKAQSESENENNCLWTVRSITLEGNRVTKDYIIKRELPVRERDTLCESTLPNLRKTATENLMNMGLFNFAEVGIVLDSTLHAVDIFIHVTEQWYFFVFPQVTFADRNVNTWLKSHKFSELSLGLDAWLYNFRGQRETLHIFPMFGYDRQISADYDIPFLTKKMQWGLFTGGLFRTSHSVLFSVVENRSVFSPRFPNHAQTTCELYVGIRYRPKIHISHAAKLQFEYHAVNDSVVSLNPHYLGDSVSFAHSLSLSYFLKIDHRNYAAYPLQGYYFDVEGKYIRTLRQENPHGTFAWLRSTFRKYYQLAHRWYYAFAVTGFSCTRSQYPFYINEASLGFDRFHVRGYEKYLFKTQHYLLGKQNIKFALLKDHVFRLFGIKNDSFGKVPLSLFLTLFSDAAIYDDTLFSPTKNLEKSLLFSAGLGLDIVTYYERVLRIELTCNRNSEWGVYFSFLEPL